jgi:hypothetical protein
MDAIERIAEQRIREALDRGDLDRLPGFGKPLQLDDDSDIPAELRVAWRILKNAGCVPPEVELRREIASVEALLLNAGDESARADASRKLDYLLTRLSAMRGGRNPAVEAAYREQLAAKLNRR